MKIIVGFNKNDRMTVSELYANAFNNKFKNIIGDKDIASSILAEGLNPKYCLSAYQDENLMGVAGLCLGKNCLINIKLSTIIKNLGLFKGIYTAILASIIFKSKDIPADELLLDAIAVQEKYRGQGIGSKLLEELFKWSKTKGYKAVHLEVVDENPKAKSLYERLGFIEISYEKTPNFINKLIEVNGITHMRKEL